MNYQPKKSTRKINLPRVEKKTVMAKKPKYDWTLKKAADLSEGAVELLKDVREEHHKRLAPYKVALLFRPEPQKQGDVQILGKAHVCTPVEKLLSGYSAAITLAWTWYDAASDDQRAALIDEQLMCFQVAEKSGKLSIRPYDVQAFREVWRRRGSYTDALVQAESVILQLQLEFPEAAPVEAEETADTEPAMAAS